MLYLMTVLTFLAAMMFYLLSPRDDGLHLDVYQAEPLIQDLISQHQAAKDYVRRWFGAHVSAVPSGDYFNLVATDNHSFEQFFPTALREYSMCDNNTGEYPGQDGCFLSRVVCIDKTSANPIDCSATPDSNRELYVVTYGGWDAGMNRPGWWPNANASRTRRNERWRRAIAQRTHGSLNCGTLYQVGADWCIDNGQVTQQDRFGVENVRCVKEVPARVIDALHISGDKNGYLFDMFFCMSPVVQGPRHYYPQGLTSYFDALDNLNTHAPVSSTDVVHNLGTTWTDLVTSVGRSLDSNAGEFPVDSDNKPYPYYSLKQSGSLDFGYHPGSTDFTISVVAALDTDLLNDSVQGGLLRIISFKGAQGADTLTPRLYIEVEGNADSTADFRLNIGKYDDTSGNFHGGPQKEGYIFKAEGVPLHKQQPFTLTLTRRGDKIELYMGGHQTLSERERKLFSGTITDDRIRDVINEAFDSNMSIENHESGGTHPAYIYAVRSFNRGLEAEDVYKIYKEDVQRYGSSLAATLDEPFEGTIYWEDASQTAINAQVRK